MTTQEIKKQIEELKTYRNELKVQKTMKSPIWQDICADLIADRNNRIDAEIRSVTEKIFGLYDMM